MTENEPTSLSEWLHNAMASRQPRMSIRMLSAESGVPRSVIGSVLRYHEHRPNVENLRRLATFFDVDLGLLWRLSWGRARLGAAEPVHFVPPPPLSAEERALAVLSAEDRQWVRDIVDHAEGLDGPGRVSVIKALIRAKKGSIPRSPVH
jgi:hypothetical protein